MIIFEFQTFYVQAHTLFQGGSSNSEDGGGNIFSTKLSYSLLIRGMRRNFRMGEFPTHSLTEYRILRTYSKL